MVIVCGGVRGSGSAAFARLPALYRLWSDAASRIGKSCRPSAPAPVLLAASQRFGRANALISLASNLACNLLVAGRCVVARATEPFMSIQPVITYPRVSDAPASR
ncbi:hypothetical protein ACIPIA_14365, partial [Bosea sp. CER48]|uniref:hypothetical protein n=1 Tax=Bosea sp. CER48 TaxID=3377035 RepID=UPI0037FF6DE0